MTSSKHLSLVEFKWQIPQLRSSGASPHQRSLKLIAAHPAFGRGSVLARTLSAPRRPRRRLSILTCVFVSRLLHLSHPNATVAPVAAPSTDLPECTLLAGRSAPGPPSRLHPSALRALSPIQHRNRSVWLSIAPLPTLPPTYFDTPNILLHLHLLRIYTVCRFYDQHQYPNFSHLLPSPMVLTSWRDGKLLSATMRPDRHYCSFPTYCASI
jgi:hypothetical protein